eukprot:CAMPEP_0119341584 /NCGR_PEP_ID=MMETSP1333-20130426/102732_1 /TAXON_ID=418940 /ORGANISM="Scyphosphaera apsteinii, Strain RCC1455" /LENGTH=419 /DNA_ID=CAMNT_0007353585 /DNA_START=95 /DNA_END=1354 /DNA_ORIENTATION=+
MQAVLASVAVTYTLTSPLRCNTQLAARGHVLCSSNVVQVGPHLTGTALDMALPSAEWGPRDVIDIMMAALHSSNADSPRPFFGYKCALRFLSPAHQAAGLALASAGPMMFAQYIQQPHKLPLATWNEYRCDGDLVQIEKPRCEAYQQVMVRPNADAAWKSVRWLLVKDGGQWMVEAVFVSEPDQPTDATFGQTSKLEPVAFLSSEQTRRLFDQLDEDASGEISLSELEQAVNRLGIGMDRQTLARLFSRFGTDESSGIGYAEFEQLINTANEAWWAGKTERCEAGTLAAILSSSATSETPREVVQTVMGALRHKDEPYAEHGAAVATRYCSPTNRASALTPAQFDRYLEEPWYRLLLEWDEIQHDEAEVEPSIETSGSSNRASEEVLVRRAGTDSWSIISYELSRHNGRWLIDSVDITE